jgi:hypothetical protein
MNPRVTGKPKTDRLRFDDSIRIVYEFIILLLLKHRRRTRICLSCDRGNQEAAAPQPGPHRQRMGQGSVAYAAVETARAFRSMVNRSMTCVAGVSFCSKNAEV